jgi:peptidyl-prolyl cis-trans isomerase SurA
MNKFFFSICILLCFCGSLLAQDDEILLTINNQPISKGEFEYVYKKNNSNLYSDKDKKTPEEYLDLFINFKLKVIEAESLRMDTSKNFVKELALYRKQVAEPYLTNVDYDEQQIKDLYYRLTHEVDASHILLKYNKNEGAKKEQEVLQKIKAIRKEIINGLSFEDAALKYSEDPSVKRNKGNLGYFSAFIMVSPFEDAAFNTPVGEISEPIKTNFGYHLIKVNDLRVNKGEMHVAHIMKSFSPNASSQEKAKALIAINAVYEKLLNGANFEELAKKESQDRRSALKGGVIPWFTAGRIDPKFSDAAFALKKDGDISEPIETPYGYHIIKRLEAHPIPSYEEAKENIERRIKQDASRENSKKKAFIEKLKKEYNFSENPKVKNFVGESVSDKNFTIPETLFTIDNINYSGSDFKKYIDKNKINQGSYISAYKRWVNDEITELENSRLEEKYPKFKYLMNEYHDGILLFNISQKKIWEYAEQDASGLEKFYKKDKNKHMWGERFKGVIISCKTPEVREKADNLFSEGFNATEVEDQINAEGDKLISITDGVWEESKNPVVDYYVWNGKTPEGFNNELTFIRGNKIPKEPKTLKEARGVYISDYQNYLEKKWVKKLHSKYKVKINKKVLSTIENE